MNTNQLSINIFLTEKFLGKCWHEIDTYYFLCTKCEKSTGGKDYITGENLNLFTPTGFFLLWEKAQKEGWWEAFISKHNKIHTMDHIFVDYINPLTFPTLLAEYLGWKETK